MLSNETRAASWSLIGAALVAAAIGVHAAVGWRQAQTVRSADLGGASALVAVSLANGPVYYGRLVEANSGFVKLDGVYYVQSFTNPANNQMENRVVNRAKTDWHGPSWMLIPRDRISLIEDVGASSRLAQLIAQEQQAASGPGPAASH